MARHTTARRRRHRRRQQRRLYVGGGAVVLILIALVFSGGLPFRGGSRADGAPSTARCSSPGIELNVISSVEKLPALRAIGEAYQRIEPAVDGRCLTIHVGPATQTLGTGLSAVATDLPGGPDVWTPESSLWLKALGAGDGPMAALARKEHPSIATSPTVLAMPRPMAEALGWPDQTVGLAKLRQLAAAKNSWAALGHADWGPVRVDRVDPRFSTAKAHATLALAYNAAGTVSPTAKQIASAGVVHARLSLDRAEGPDDAHPNVFLAGLRRADRDGAALQYVSIAALDEASVLTYNHGSPLASPMTKDNAKAPTVPLVAFYPPEGVFVSDHPYIVLTDLPLRRRAAQAFLEHLQTPASQAVLRSYGFRDRRGVAAPEATAELGVLAQQPVKTLPHPEPAVVSAMVLDTEKLKSRSNVLTVIDISGSMAVKVGGSLTRMDLAKRAAVNSMSLYDADDDGGLWQFSSTPRELVPLGALEDPVGGPPRRDAIRRQLAKLKPTGDTALYNTIWQAHQRVVANYQSNTRNSVILLSDGRNDINGGLTLRRLVAKLAKSDPKRPVRILFIAYGEEADVPALRQIAKATGGEVFEAPNPAQIDLVFAAAIASA